MLQFSYQAITKDTGKIVKGKMQGKNKEEVIGRIKEQNLITYSIKENKPSFFQKVSFSNIFSDKQKNLILFTDQLSNLMGSGIQLGEALKVAGQLLDNGDFKSTVETVHNELVGGKSFAEALATSPQYFSTSYVNMIRAGEEGGFLPLTCNRLAQNLEDNSQLKAFIISSLTYPIILLSISLIAVTVMLLYVLPKFALIYDNYNQALPRPTAILMGISSFISNYWLVVIISLGILSILVYQWYNSKEGKKKVDKFLLNFPIMSDFFTKINVVKMCRSLGSMLESGVPLLKSLDVSSYITSNTLLQSSLKEAAEKVKKGKQLSEALSKCDVFPEMMIYMIAVGERTGQLAQMLLQIANNFERDAKKSLERLMKIFEPVMILIMGVLIGFIIIAMLLPILGMNNISM